MMKQKCFVFCFLLGFMFLVTGEGFARNFILSKNSTFSSFDEKGYTSSGKMYIKVFKDDINNTNVQKADFSIETAGKDPVSGNLAWDEELSAFTATAELTTFNAGEALQVTLMLESNRRRGRVSENISVLMGDDGPVANAGSDHINAGYGVTVTLDGRESTGKDLTYAWAVSEGSDTDVTLVNNDDGTASFTLPTFEAFVNPEPYQPVYDKAKVFAMTYDMMGAFEVRLTVTDDAGNTSSDFVEVTATSRTSGLTNLPLGKPVYFVAPELETYNWVLATKPNGSNASLNDATGRISNFTPDLTGKYVIEEKNSGSSIDINTGTFVGVGTIDDDKRPKLPQCAVCHRGIHKAWKGTHHSFALTNKYNGVLTDGETPFPFFREFCVKCHTTGLDKAATAINDGFDDKASKEGWTYPLPDQNGNVDPENFNNLLKDFPATAQRAQVECEMCHGPGSKPHVFDETAIDRTLQPTLCGQCHAFEPFHNRYVEWLSSKHARSVRMGFEPLTGVPAGVNPEHPMNGCGTHCHTIEGFLRFRVDESVPDPDLIYKDRRNKAAPVGCVLCHAPMSNFENVDSEGTPIEDGRKQLRFFGKTTIPKWNADETEVINVEVDAGPAAVCTKCHLHGMYLKNGDGTPKSEPQPLKVGEDIPRHQQAQVYFGIGASEYDPDAFGLGAYPEPTHAKAFREEFDEPQYCVRCHMLRYDANEEQFGKLGSHTWNMKFTVEDELGRGEEFDTVFENGKPCFDCHEGAMDENAPGGYSFAFGHEGEEFLEELLDQLKGLLPVDERGSVVWNPTGDDFGTEEDTSDDVPPLTPVQTKAAFNYYFIENDGSDGHHNMAYAVRLIGDAIRSLGEVPIEREEG